MKLPTKEQIEEIDHLQKEINLLVTIDGDVSKKVIEALLNTFITFKHIYKLDKFETAKVIHLLSKYNAEGILAPIGITLDEWEEVEKGKYQNKRKTNIFSYNGGKDFVEENNFKIGKNVIIRKRKLNK